jgi:hypothetical protein
MDDVGVKLNIQIGGNDVLIKDTPKFGRNEKLVYPCCTVDFSLSSVFGVG